MTNKQLVSEVCRVIRGIALNYPEGLEAIAEEIHALRPEEKRREENQTVADGQTSAATPTKRRPGRPRKHPKP